MRALARQVRSPLWRAAGLPLLSGLLLLPQAWALARALQLLAVDRLPLESALPWLGLAAVLLAVRAGLSWGAGCAGQQAAEDVKLAVRQALFARMLGSGVLWTRARTSGALADAIGARVELLDGYYAHYLPAMASATVLPLVFCVVLSGFDLVAALVLALTVPAIPVFMALVGWGAEAAGRRHVDALARLSGLFADRVRGLSTLVLHGRASDEAERVAQASEEVRARTLSVLRIAFLSSAVLEFFAALGVAGLAVYFGLSFLGFLDLRASPLTLETALFCLLMAPEVYLPMRQLAAHYHDRANARALVAGLDELFDGLPEPGEGARESAPRDGAAAVTVPPHADGPWLRVAGLRVDVPGRAPVRLAGLVELAPGASVALTGPSGSGKTTLLEAIAGLRPHEGAVELGGRAVADWPDAVLRRTLLLIPQRPWLMPGTLAGNLRLARPDADDAQLRQALEAAGLGPWLARQPQGLGTPVGTRGHGLSGGQAQRLALARMFLSDARVLLLDEPTAHLDDATRDRVLASILDFARGRILVVATHDPAVAARMAMQWRVGADGEVSA